MGLTVEQRRVIVVYLISSGLFTLSTSIIWGVNTLFLLAAGLDIFHVLLVNTAFTVGQIIFEVPTGVVADTIGRRASLLLGIGTLVVATLGYVAGFALHWGLWAFVLFSVLLGLGFTFQTGAPEAWLVDALDSVGWRGGKERVFAWGQMMFGASMIGGTLVGGVLGQIDLAWPYYARAAILVLCLVATAALIRDQGFEPRPLVWSRFGHETRRILRAGTAYGWRNPVVRPLLFVSFAQGVFFLFAFYSLAPFYLTLLGRDLVWVAAALTAGGSAAGILGNLLVRRAMGTRGRGRRPGRVLAWVAAGSAACALAIAGVGILTPRSAHGPGVFALATALWLAFGLLSGIAMPVRQAFLNDNIPSEQRATVLSVDAFFEDVGGSAGQPALGLVSKLYSIPLGWAVGSLGLLASWPLYLAADRADRRRGEALTTGGARPPYGSGSARADRADAR